MQSHVHKLSLANSGGTDIASGVSWSTTGVKKWNYASDMIESVGGGDSQNLQPYRSARYLIKV